MMQPQLLSEPAMVASWGKSCGGEALLVLLLTLKGQRILELRTWWRGDTLRPDKDFAFRVKHPSKLAGVFAVASRNPKELGVSRLPCAEDAR